MLAYDSPTKIIQNFFSKRTRPYSLYHSPKLQPKTSTSRLLGLHRQHPYPNSQSRHLRRKAFPNGAHQRNYDRHQITLKNHKIPDADPPESAVTIRDNNGDIIETTLSDALDISRQDWTNLCRPLFELINTRVSEALKVNANIESLSFSEFKAYWAQVFDNMRAELVQCGESELFITYPPLKTLEIEILDGAADIVCPCCEDYRDADIVIRSEEGITRDDLLKALRDRLYGENARRKRMPLKRHYSDGRLVVKTWNYPIRNVEDVFSKGYDYDELRIWMYCVGVGKGEGYGDASNRSERAEKNSHSLRNELEELAALRQRLIDTKSEGSG